MRWGWKKVQITDSEDGSSARIDAVTEALMTITYPHHEIHEGSRYFLTDLVTLGNEATRNYLITTPDSTKQAHFIVEVSANKETKFELFEDTDSSGGTSLTPRNRNRNFSDAATVAITHTPTVTSDGTRLVIRQFGEAIGAQISKIGGSANERLELVLKQNTKYLLRVTSADADDDINVSLDWYEHTPRN